MPGPDPEGRAGYDPVFYVPAYGQTFSEMPQQTKNQISHRARAMEALADRLGKMLETTPEDKGESI